MNKRPQPFILLSTAHGTMIINRNDQVPVDGGAYGVGYQLMNAGVYDPEEVALTLDLIRSRAAHFGPGVVVVDCGANVGVFTLEWAKELYEVGHVYSFEAQEKIFYALAGNVVINNCHNVTVRNVAVGATNGVIEFPEPNYSVSGSFGSLELKKVDRPSDFGQVLDYANPTLKVPLITLDSLNFKRLDFLKVDVEGMELDVLNGAVETIQRCKPQIVVEVLKSDANKIAALLSKFDYTRRYNLGLNLVFLHQDDPLKITTQEAPAQVPVDVH